MKYIFLFFVFISLPLTASNEVLKEKLNLLLDSATLYQNTATEVVFLKEGLSLAKEMHDTRSHAFFLTRLTRNAYNRWIPDSIGYWGEKGITIAKEHEYYPLMFDILSLLCLRDLFQDNYESASDRADHLYKLGKELNQPAGIIASYEAMGILYRQTSRPKQALASYKDGLVFLRQTLSRPSQELQFISYIIEILLAQDELEDATRYIDQYHQIIDDYANNRYADAGTISLDRCRFLLECYRTDLYIRQQEYTKAKASYQASVEYKEIVHDVYVKYYFDLNTIAYHQFITKELPLALRDIENLIESEKAPEMVLRKADILSDMGNYKESVRELKTAIHLKDSINDFELNNQLNSLRSRLDVNKLELEKKELEAKRNELRIRIYTLCMVFTIILLVILVVALVRTFRVKNQLKRSEHELKIAKDKAEESSRLKTIFIQNMSHEIRTPLNAIVGFSSLMAEMPDQATQFSSLIEENSNMLLKLVDDLLNISVIEAKNHTTLTPEKCDLNDCCQKAIDSMKGWLKDDVKLTFTPERQSCMLVSDPLRLHQILTNLLTNASKYTQDGEINLTYIMMSDHKQVKLIVTDTGVGIPSGKTDAIFERFVKLDDFKQGSGLGLYICRMIVTAMDGKIYVDTDYREGARFIVEIPIHLTLK
ncbi:MAG: HAMP domain-containing sensor histidine kinase [Bacteroidales bacterium]